MADDITARILLSVEYADAVKKCKDVEVGLEDITKARQSDLNTVKAATNAANANAQAMEREAAAAEKVAKATKKKQESSDKVVKGWEVLGITQEEYERRAKAAADASAKATAEYNKRWDKRLSADAAPQKAIERNKYFSDFKKSFNDTFSKNTINATSNLKKLNKTVAQSENAFLRATRGVGRSLGHIARASGRSLGMEMTTEGITGAGGTFMAGALAIGGVASLIKGIVQLTKENRQAQRETADREISYFAENTERLRQEIRERQKMLFSLKEYNNYEKLSNVQKIKQTEIVEKLSQQLGYFEIEIDNATGRIKKFAALEEQQHQKDVQSEIDAIERQQRLIQSQIERNEIFLGGGKASVGEKIFAQAFGSLGRFIADYWHQAINSDEIQTARQQNEKLYEQSLKNQIELNKRNQDLSVREREKRAKIRAAETLDVAAKENEILKEYKRVNNERAKLARFEGSIGKQREVDTITDAKRLKELQNKLPKAKQDVDDYYGLVKHHNLMRDEYLAANREYLKIEKEIFEIEQRQANRNEIEEFINLQISGMREQVRMQNLIKQGRRDEAALLEIQLDAQKKIKKEGWSPKQAQEWAELQAYQQDQANRTAQKQSIAGFMQRESFKYRDTTTAAVMANSLEGVRLQNRQLVANTPEKALLNVNQKQYSMLEQIKKGIDKLAPKSGSNTTIQTQRV